MDNLLLATDLDDTLIGDDDAQRHLNEIISANDNVRFVYVTGRSLDKYLLLQNERPLLEPDALITALGTEIYIKNERLADWPIVAGWNRDEIEQRLSTFVSLKLQPISEQRDYKLSYFLESEPNLVSDIKEALTAFDVDITYSMDLYLDILPKNINKGTALKFLANLWKVKIENFYASGDSLNDISMLRVGKAIIVGNAKEELKKWSTNEGPQVYEANNQFANGIIEGLEHFGVV